MTMKGSLLRLLAVASLVAACGSAPASGSVAPGVSQAPSSPSGAAPSETPEGSPAPSFVGEFAPVPLKGKGDKTVTFDIPEDAIALASMSHPGKGAFEVRAYDEDGRQTQVLVKTSGPYKGLVLFDLIDHSVSFKVTAAGAWKITVKPTEAAGTWDRTKALKGKSDTVAQVAPSSEAGDTIVMNYTGSGRFAVRAHTPEDETYLVDQVGKYKGTRKLPEGTMLLEIRAKGPWSIKSGS
jgi:hypothetical protein